MISCAKYFRAMAVVVLATAVMPALGQVAPAQRTIPASKAEVERALKGLAISTGGRLPILDGFVSATEALDRYRRGYYQYSIEVTPSGAGSSTVRATAKITAWYEGPNAASSGYRVLHSNGRLESDLLDQLEDALKTKAATGEVAPSGAAPPPSTTAGPVPDAPRPATPPVSGLAKAAAPLPLRPPASPADKNLQELRDEASNLEQILENQAHPTNLAIVKQAHTPIYARPLEASKVVLEADAEDEFQIIESEAAWVHVQVSGLSRGWIRRSSVELPTEVATKVPAAAEEADSATKEGFRQTREETSLFPGKWQPLEGKKVKIIWVQPFENKGFGQRSKLLFAKSVFRQEYGELSKEAPTVAGIVVVFDSADGGMAAATFSALQQWRAGHLTEEAFWKQCWLDPAEAFKKD